MQGIVLDIANAMGTYGVPLVLAAFMAFILYSIIKSRIESREKDEKEKRDIERENARATRENERDRIQNERFDGFLKTVVSILQNGVPHTADEQEKDRALHEHIQNNLDVLVEGGAVRAYYFSFHNGGRNVLGHSMLKMSVVAESISRGEHIMNKYQNIPRSMFTLGYKELDEKGEYYVYDIAQIEKKDQASYNFLNEHHSSAALFRSVKTDDGLIIGFVGAEFDNIDVDWERQKAAVARSASRIAGMLIKYEQ